MGRSCDTRPYELLHREASFQVPTYEPSALLRGAGGTCRPHTRQQEGLRRQANRRQLQAPVVGQHFAARCSSESTRLLAVVVDFVPVLLALFTMDLDGLTFWTRHLVDRLLLFLVMAVMTVLSASMVVVAETTPERWRNGRRPIRLGTSQQKRDR